MTAQLRAYAVGAAFSVRDVDDDLRWRPTDYYWSDVYYGRPRNQTTDANGRPDRRARRARTPVATRVDPSRIRTPEQRKTVGQRVCNNW